MLSLVLPLLTPCVKLAEPKKASNRCAVIRATRPISLPDFSPFPLSSPRFCFPSSLSFTHTTCQALRILGPITSIRTYTFCLFCTLFCLFRSFNAICFLDKPQRPFSGALSAPRISQKQRSQFPQSTCPLLRLAISTSIEKLFCRPGKSLHARGSSNSYRGSPKARRDTVN